MCKVRGMRPLICLPLFLFFTACGYTLQHRLKETFQVSKGIFVPVFDNLTEETGAERIFTNALIRELISHDEIVMADRSEGAWELKGTLVQLDALPTVQTEPGFRGLQPYRRLPSEIGVAARISLSLKDPQGKVIWTRDFAGFRRLDAPLNRTYDYESPSSLGPMIQSLGEYLQPEIARTMMQDVYDEMVDQWAQSK